MAVHNLHRIFSDASKKLIRTQINNIATEIFAKFFAIIYALHFIV
jgi:hypothetical protein